MCKEILSLAATSEISAVLLVTVVRDKSSAVLMRVLKREEKGVPSKFIVKGDVEVLIRNPIKRTWRIYAFIIEKVTVVGSSMLSLSYSPNDAYEQVICWDAEQRQFTFITIESGTMTRASQQGVAGSVGHAIRSQVAYC